MHTPHMSMLLKRGASSATACGRTPCTFPSTRMYMFAALGHDSTCPSHYLPKMTQIHTQALSLYSAVLLADQHPAAAPRTWQRQGTAIAIPLIEHVGLTALPEADKTSYAHSACSPLSSRSLAVTYNLGPTAALRMGGARRSDHYLLAKRAGGLLS